MSSSPVSPVTTPPGGGSGTEFIYRVIQSYNPVHEGEIALTTGDIVSDTKNLGNGWTLGRNVTRDTLGIFPSKFIRPMSDVHSNGSSPSGPKVSAAPQLIHSLPNSSKHPKVALVTKDECYPSRSSTGPRGPRSAQYREEHPLVDRHRGDRQESEEPPLPPPPLTPKSKSSKDKPRPPPRTSSSSPPGGGASARGEESVPLQHTRPAPPIPGSGSTDTEPDLDAGDLTPGEGDYSALSAKKPHMVVKPNQGSRNSTPRPELRPDPRWRNSPMNLVDMESDPDTPPVGTNGQAPYALPVVPKVRTAHPPAKLPLSHVTGPDTGHVTEHPRMTDSRPDVAAVQTSSLLDLPSMQDRATSPMTVPAEARVTINPNPETIPSNVDFERDNLANESMQDSPDTPRDKHCDPKKCYYRDYGPVETQSNVLDGAYQPPLRYKPILKNRHQKVADSKGQHIYYKETKDRNRLSILILALLVGLLVGGIVFLWMFFFLGYSLLVAAGICMALFILMTIILSLSRMCRCTLALLLPSMCTTRGRVSFLLILTGFLLYGPVLNIFHNMHEVSSSLSCITDKTYDQTMMLLRPYDKMMAKLNGTIHVLQQSAHNVSVGLNPLDEGLADVERGLNNGRIQLMSTGKVRSTPSDNNTFWLVVPFRGTSVNFCVRCQVPTKLYR